MHPTSAISSLLIAMLALPAAVSIAAPPAAAKHLPPPGLYRVEAVASTVYRDGATIKQKAGSAGATVRAQSPSGRAVVASGTAPAQVCIGAGAANGGLPLPAASANQHCKSTPPVSGPNGTAFSSRCDAADINVVVRKLDARTWEMTTTSSEHLGAKGMLDFEQQRKMFETSLKNATTPEERADAQYTLDHWDEFKQEMRENAAASGAAAAPGATTRMNTASSRLTRVAESFKGAAAPAAMNGR